MFVVLCDAVWLEVMKLTCEVHHYVRGGIERTSEWLQNNRVTCMFTADEMFFSTIHGANVGSGDLQTHAVCGLCLTHVETCDLRLQWFLKHYRLQDMWCMLPHAVHLKFAMYVIHGCCWNFIEVYLCGSGCLEMRWVPEKNNGAKTM